MNKMPLIALVGMLSLSSAVAAEEEFSYTAKVGADMWWGSTKLNEVRQDEDSNSPSVYFAFEHNAPMLPNASFRYTSIDTDALAFDKYDYTFYYTLLEHKLMNFDAGVTLLSTRTQITLSLKRVLKQALMSLRGVSTVTLRSTFLIPTSISLVRWSLVIAVA